MGTLLCKGTLIPTAHGYLPIETLKSGAVVYSEFGNPIPILDISDSLSEISRIHIPRVTYDNRLVDANNSLDIGSDSLIPMKTSHVKNYASIGVSEAADSGVFDYDDDGDASIMKWSVKHGQGMNTPYVMLSGTDSYDSVAENFAKTDYQIPDAFAYGSSLQKMQTLDCLKKLARLYGGYYYLQHTSKKVLQQVAFLVESLGYTSYFMASDMICFQTEQKFRDVYLDGIAALGYTRRVYGIHTEGEIPFQAGLFHCIVDSI